MGMSVLQAVNEMLAALGVRPVATYAAGLALEASQHLDRWSEKVQARGWACNTEGASRRWGESGIPLAPPDKTIAYSVAPTGTFQAGETVTEATSGATARFQYIASSKLYLTALTGTLTGGKALTGGTSGATVTGTTLAAVTSGSIYVDWTILSADPVCDTYGDLVLRGGRFYDRENDTYTFGQPIRVVQVRKLSFGDLPGPLAELIAVHALIDLSAKVKLPVPADAFKRLADAKAAALQEDLDASDLNLADSRYHRTLGGRAATMVERR